MHFLESSYRTHHHCQNLPYLLRPGLSCLYDDMLCTTPAFPSALCVRIARTPQTQLALNSNAGSMAAWPVDESDQKKHTGNA